MVTRVKLVALPAGIFGAKLGVLHGAIRLLATLGEGWRLRQTIDVEIVVVEVGEEIFLSVALEPDRFLLVVGACGGWLPTPGLKGIKEGIVRLLLTELSIQKGTSWLLRG